MLFWLDHLHNSVQKRYSNTVFGFVNQLKTHPPKKLRQRVRYLPPHAAFFAPIAGDHTWIRFIAVSKIESNAEVIVDCQ